MDNSDRGEERPIAVVVLAAGQGTRMNSDLPKPLHKLGGVPLIAHALAAAGSLSPHVSSSSPATGPIRSRKPSPTLPLGPNASGRRNNWAPAMPCCRPPPSWPISRAM